MVLATVFILLFLHTAASSPDCQKRDYGNGSPVCVCNVEHCDFADPIEPIGEKEAVVYTSDKSGRRLERTVIHMQSLADRFYAYNNFSHPTFHHIGMTKICTNEKITLEPETIANVTIDPSIRKQAIAGFGGAFTDASGINIRSLPESVQDVLLRSYFSKEGSEYTIGRVPISSTDFSARKYSYDDVPNDFQLQHFALAEEDMKYKIPYIKAAQNYSTRPMRIFGSSWSAPAWMKTSGKMEGNGTLLGEPKPGDRYYTTWANYYVKFLQEYQKHNITFWALTGQNEPTTGFIYNYEWQTQGFTAEMQRDFIKYNLGPALQQNGFENVSIMILDDNRFLLPSWARTILSDKEARKYVSHIAVHFYLDEFTPPFTLDNTHKEFPDFDMIATEACVGTMGGPEGRQQHVILGSWERAEQYCHDIIEDLNHWVTGWVDWNIALDEKGGPNWANNFVDSPVIVNGTAGEFYKQPMFYALAHFSKFLPPGSFRVGLTPNVVSPNVELTAFLNSNGYKTIILMNKGTNDESVSLQETQKNEVISVTLPAHSIVTVLWK